MNQAVLNTLIGVWSVLGLATLIAYFKKQPELTLRTKSWWYILSLVTIVTLGPRIVSISALAALSLFSFREYLRLVGVRDCDRGSIRWAFGGIIAQYLFVFSDQYDIFVVLIPIYAFLIIPARQVLTGVTQGYLSSVSKIHWGLMQTAFSLGHVAYLLNLPLEENRWQGPALILCLLILTEANDISQYVWGKTLGKRKIVPLVSPKKTWGGFIGGVVTTTLLASFLVPYLVPLSRSTAAWLGALMAVAGFLGDVTVSAVKRDVGVKDSGTLIPGHGGLLDRVDSLIFTAPLFFRFVRYVLYSVN